MVGMKKRQRIVKCNIALFANIEIPRKLH